MRYSLIVALGIWSSCLGAQDSPRGYTMTPDDISDLPVLDVGTLDREELLAEARESDKRGGISMYGKIISYPMDQQNSGTWTVLSNGDRIWQLRFRSSGALGVNVFFDTFFLPQGASVFIYSPDLLWFDGPYTSEESNVHGLFRTAECFGEEAILEYYEPADVIESPQISISGFGHYFRYIEDLRDERGGSGNCQVDVNCSEGSEWQDQRQSVVKLSIPYGSNSIGSCTGSLVNNTGLDCKNYILTAYHCVNESDAEQMLLVSAQFNYQRSGCGSGTATTLQSRTGSFLRADSNDGGGISGSDFALLELEDAIPSSYNPFYAGWDATGSTPTSGPGGYSAVSIHHPNGDVKKISTTNSVLTGTYSAPNHHWRVVWKSTANGWGVTEGGSSGSPLFNRSKRIIGTLTGGTSFCSSPSSSDYYGKMDKHWSGNPNPVNEDLEDWLDPINSGVKTLDGAYRNPELSQPCAITVGVGELDGFEFDDIALYPTLASDMIRVQTSMYQEVREVRVFGSDGRQIKSFSLQGEITQLDLNTFSEGLYYMTFIHKSGSHLTKKFSVFH